MRYLLRIACISLLMSFPLWAQIQPSTVAEIEESIELRQQHYEQSVLKNYPVRNVGPVVMSGRVSDIAVHPDNPRVFYTAFGSGEFLKPRIVVTPCFLYLIMPAELWVLVILLFRR